MATKLRSFRRDSDYDMQDREGVQGEVPTLRGQGELCHLQKPHPFWAAGLAQTQSAAGGPSGSELVSVR